MEGKKIVKIILICVILMVFIDQLSKILVDKFMPEETVILQNVLTFSKIESGESALNLNKQNLSNIALFVLVLAIAIRFVITQKKNLKIKVVVYISMIIAGGFSNLIDRIFRGFVFEFIEIGDFPMFNLADFFIILGWILFVIDVIKNIRNVSE